MNAAKPIARRKLLTVEPETVWRRRTVLLAGVLLAISSVLGLYIIDKANDALQDALFGWMWALNLGVVLVYPIASVVVLFRHIPRAMSGLLYTAAFGLGWHTAMSVAQAIEYGIWKGFAPDDRTLLAWLASQAAYLVATLALSMTILMTTWLACRLLRGPVLIQTGSLCEYCGYDLRGLPEPRCPECGAGFRAGDKTCL